MAAMFGGCNKEKLPSVETAAVTHITAYSAECGGTVSDNGTSVTVRGVCWSESPNPTIDNPHSTDGSGTGSFSSLIENLSPGTTYYIRAYAMNDNGVGYGEENTFTTLEAIGELYARMLCKPKGWKMVAATSSPAYQLSDGTFNSNLMQCFFQNYELDDILVFKMDGTHWIYDNLNAVVDGAGRPLGQWYFDNLVSPTVIHMRVNDNDYWHTNYFCQILNLTENEFKIKLVQENPDPPAKENYRFTITYIPVE